MRYSAGPYTGAPTNRTTQCVLNGSVLEDIALTGTANWSTWNIVTTKMFLQAGINRIAYNAYTIDDSDAINIYCLDVAATTGTITSYEAEASGNTLGGTAVISTNSAASGGKYVGYLGYGTANYVTVNNVNVATAGTYRLVIQYANGELGAGASNYNSNVVDRYFDVSVNSGTAQKIIGRNTFGWSNWRTTVCTVTLNAGNNTIKFNNDSTTDYAPDLDKIEVASAIG
jgi:hypothetical protein